MPTLEDLEKTAQSHLGSLVESGRIKSVAAAVTSSDTTWIGRFGDVQLDGIFEIGSITKTLTTSAFARLVLEGKLAFDDPVERHLPDGVTIPTFPGSRPINLLDLATHTSGLKRLPSNLMMGDFNPTNPYAHYTDELLLDALPESELDGPPGETVSYSNYGFGLLGYCLGRAARTDYYSVIKLLCEELEMRETSVSLPSSLGPRRVQGFNEAGEAVPHWDMPAAIAGCGGVQSTIEDMAKYLNANIAPNQTALDMTLESAQQPRVRVSDRHTVALGWHIRHQGGPHYIWHNGGTGGFGSMLVFERTSVTGAVVLSNTYHQKELDERTFDLVADLAERH